MTTARARGPLVALLTLALTGTCLVAGSGPTGRTAAASPTANAPFVQPMPAATTAAPTGRMRGGTWATTEETFAASAGAPAGVARAGTTAATGRNVTSLSQGTDMLDIFGIDAGQRIYHASWRPDDANGWNRSAQLNGGVAAVGTSVYAVSRFTGRLDAFAVGTDHKVYTAFKDTGVGRGEWRGWWQIPGLTVLENTSVTAVRVDRNNLMILAVGADNTIYENRWSAALPDIWQGWRAVPGQLRVSSTVFGIALGDGVVDIYATGATPESFLSIPLFNRWNGGWRGWEWAGDRSDDDGRANIGSMYPVRYGPNEIALMSLWWIQVGNEHQFRIMISSYTISTGRWSKWDWLREGKAHDFRSPIVAVSRRTGHLDVFHAGRDNHVYTAGFDGANWGGWWKIGDDVMAETGVFATSRSTDHLDVFAISPNTGTYTTGWDPANGWGGWFGVGPFGQAGDAVEFVDTIDFNGGTNVDGWVRLMISSSGAWSFRGHFNSAGPLTYRVGYTSLVAIPNGRGFVFQAKGTAEGWIDGGDDFNFDRAGVDPDIAANWSQIRTSGEWSARARTSLDVGRLLSDLLVAAAYAIRIQDVVSGA